MSKLALLILLPGLLTAQAQYQTHFTVAQDGSGDFTSIKAAILACKAFPDEPITLFIKKGVYEEKIEVYEWNTNLTIRGENRDSTIISWDDHFHRVNLGRNSTFHTFTLKIAADDVTLENLTIHNTAGPVGQAVALHVAGDRVVVRNCTILGHQDTVYLTGENSRSYFETCFIEGTTDFIFGSGTGLFYSCILHSKANSYITAASTPSAVHFGFVFRDCQLTADPDVHSVFLGRPWRSYAKTVFIACVLGSHIQKEGWKKWTEDMDVRGVYYAEYQSKGPGASPTTRVAWSYQMQNEEEKNYTNEKILRGWNP